jgi:hypothetical protein
MSKLLFLESIDDDIIGSFVGQFQIPEKHLGLCRVN